MIAVLAAELNMNGIDVRMISASPKERKGLIAIASRQGLWLASPNYNSEPTDGEQQTASRCQLKDSTGRWPDFGCVTWSEKQTILIAASSQKAIRIWDCERESPACRIDNIDSAQRAVTDLDWSFDLLASAAMDGSICLHDYRENKAASIVLNSKVLGFAEVRSNKGKFGILASSHGGQANSLKLWDVRSPSRPFGNIVCHTSGSVCRFDWSSLQPDEIASCSPSESSVKLWRIDNSLHEPYKIIPISGDVCLVRYDDDGERLLTANCEGRISIIGLIDPFVPIASFKTNKDVQKNRKVQWLRGAAPFSSNASSETRRAEVVTVCTAPVSALRCWALCAESTVADAVLGCRLAGRAAAQDSDARESGEGADANTQVKSEEKDLFEALGRLQQGEARVHVRTCSRDSAALDILIGGETHPAMHVRLRKPWLRPVPGVGPGSDLEKEGAPPRWTAGRDEPGPWPEVEGRGDGSGSRRRRGAGGGDAGAGQDEWAGGVKILRPSGRRAAGVVRRMVDALRPTKTDRGVEALVASIHAMSLLQDECDALFWEGGSDSDGDLGGAEAEESDGGTWTERGTWSAGRGARRGRGDDADGGGDADEWDWDGEQMRQGGGNGGGGDGGEWDCDGGGAGGGDAWLGSVRLAPLHPLHALQSRLSLHGAASAVPAHTHGPPYRRAGPALGPNGEIWVYRGGGAVGGLGRDVVWQGAGRGGLVGRAGRECGGAGRGRHEVALVALGTAWGAWGEAVPAAAWAYHMQPCDDTCATCGDVIKMDDGRGELRWGGEGVDDGSRGGRLLEAERQAGLGKEVVRCCKAGAGGGDGHRRRGKGAGVERACAANAGVARRSGGWAGAARVWEVVGHVAVEAAKCGRWKHEAAGRVLLGEALKVCWRHRDLQTGACARARATLR